MTSAWRRLLMVPALGGLLVAACGDDDDEAEPAETAAPATTSEAEAGTTTPGTTAEGGGTTLEVTLTDEALEGVPDEVSSGVITLTYSNEASGPSDLSFIRIPEDLTEAEFRTIFSTVVGEEGSPIPEELESVSGLPETSPGESSTASVELEPGRHFVVAAPGPAEEEEGEAGADTTGSGADTTGATEAPATSDGEEGAEQEGPSPEAFVIAEVTVSDDDSGAELPETDGTITAEDYSFEVDVQPGDTFTFVNDGPDQIHHAVLVGFGSAEVAAVEENLVAFFESEGDAAPPPGINPEEMSFEVGGSGVFTPGLSGTFSAQIEPGTTYAVVCFIQDRAGGPPHLFGENMFEVFTVD